MLVTLRKLAPNLQTSQPPKRTRRPFATLFDNLLEIECLESRLLLSASAFPDPFERLEPYGSSISTREVTGNLATSAEIDTFELDLAPNQVLSLLVDPDPGFQPTLRLLSPDNTTLGSVTSASSGIDAGLQSITIAQAGTYTIEVSASASTSGNYALRAVLNAGLEIEDTTAMSSLPLDSSLLSSPQDRWAVLGKSSTASDSDAFTLDLSGYVGTTISIYLAGQHHASQAGGTLELYNASATLVATAVANPLGANAANYDLGILDYSVATSGVYTLAFTSDGDGEYCIYISNDAALETEVNNNPDDALVDLTGGGIVSGYLGQNNRLFGFKAVAHEMIEYDAVTGAEARRVTLPSLAGGESYTRALAFDGNSIFVTTSSANLYELDPDSFSVRSIHSLASLGITITADDVGDLAAVGGFIAVSKLSTNEVFFIDPSDFTLEDSWSAGVEIIPGMAGAGSRGSLFMLFLDEFGNQRLGEFNARNGDLIQQHNIPHVKTLRNNGIYGGSLAFANGNVHLAGKTHAILDPFTLWADSMWLVMDPDSGEFIEKRQTDDIISFAGDEVGAAISGFSQGTVGSPSVPTSSESESNDTLGTANVINVGTQSTQSAVANVEGTITTSDLDLYELDLKEGDILTFAVRGIETDLELLDSSGNLLVGSAFTGFADSTITTAHIARSPESAYFSVTPSDGTYYLRVSHRAQTGDYTLQIKADRPILEGQPVGSKQIIYLDFNGAQTGPTQLGLETYASIDIDPLADSLSDWGLSSGDLNDVIDEIVQVVTNDLNVAASLNANFGFEIRNSRDHADPSGLPNVSRVLIGYYPVGLPSYFGMSAVDGGNLSLQDLAVVQLNNFADFINNTTLALGKTKIDLAGLAIGRVVSHEIGHFLVGPHGSGLMSTGSGVQNEILPYMTGLGPDDIFGSSDDVTIEFTSGPTEGGTGTVDQKLNLAWALSEGTVGLADVGASVISVSPGTAASYDRNVTEIVVTFSEAVTSGSAGDADAYELIYAGSNGLFEGGSGDDTVIAVSASVVSSTQVELTPASGPLCVGRYQLRIRGAGTDAIVDADDGNPLNSLSGASGGADELRTFQIAMEPGDLYEITLAAGDVITVYTSTPELGNTVGALNPMIVVLDSGGVPLASDGNGHPDDVHNAFLDFTAPSTGTYLIQVAAESGAGEYVLHILPNEAPVAAITGSTSAVRGQSRAFTLTATDSSTFDQDAGFDFTIDWNGDSIVDQYVSGTSGTIVYHTFETTGNYTVKVTATDRLDKTSTIASHAIEIKAWELQADEVNPSLTNLVYGGTGQDGSGGALGDGVDVIEIIPGFLGSLFGVSGSPTVVIWQDVLDGTDLADDASSCIAIYTTITGRIIVFGQAGSDDITTSLIGEYSGSLLAAEIHAGDGDDTIEGGSLADTILGGAGNDRLVGGTRSNDGVDILLGDGGSDTLIGHKGGDILVGGDGDDRIEGNDGDDLLYGQGDNDLLDGANGADVIVGDAGNDTLLGGNDVDFLIGDEGDDRLEGGAGNDLYLFERDDNSVNLGSDVLVEILSPNDVFDAIIFADFEASDGGVNIDLSLTTPQNVHADLSITLNSGMAFELLGGTVGDDTLRGNGRDNIIVGEGGNDLIYGEDTSVPTASRDLLVGGDGADTLNGGAKDDLLITDEFSFGEEDLAALLAIMTEWVSGRDYEDRVANISGTGSGTRANADYFFEPSVTVLDDGDVDHAFGDGEEEADWFLINSLDDIADNSLLTTPAEIVTDLD